MGRAFELLCVVLLGVGQMCIMTGYNTQSFVQESVIHSIHGRDPGKISEYAGYYGVAVMYVAFVTVSLIGPYILATLGPKLTLLAGSLGFTVYQVEFLFLNEYLYYIACFVMGAGFATFYAGQGSYLTGHSTRQTIEANSAIQWAITCGAMIFGGGILSLVFVLKGETNDILKLNDTSSLGKKYRNYSDPEVLYIYGTLAAVTIISNIIFILIPSREIDNCIEGKDSLIKRSFIGQLAEMKNAILDSRMLLLTTNFVHLGLFTAFWVSIYPTSFTFTHQLRDQTFLPAIYSICVGLGEVIMGFFLGFMSRRIRNFGLKPTMWIAFVLTSLVILVILGSTSPWSTVRPSNEAPLLFETNSLICALIALLIGLADSCVNTVRTVICALALPKSRPQAFSVSKMYQALAGMAIMSFSPNLSIYHYSALLFTSLCLSTFCFLRVANATRKMEKKQTTDSLSPIQEKF